jgi:hypothetical protein
VTDTRTTQVSTEQWATVATVSATQATIVVVEQWATVAQAAAAPAVRKPLVFVVS